MSISTRGPRYKMPDVVGSGTEENTGRTRSTRARVAKIIGAVAVSATMLTATTPAGAAIAAPSSLSTAGVATADASPSTGVGYNGESVDAALVAKFDRYVWYSETASRYTISVPAAVAKADAAGTATARAAVRAANHASLTGSYQVVSRGQVVTSHGLSLQAPTYGKHGGISKHWWGISLWLDHWATGRLRAILATGGGIAAVAAALTSWTGVGGISGGAIAAILAFGSAALWLCDWHDRGVTLNAYIIGGVTCWPR